MQANVTTTLSNTLSGLDAVPTLIRNLGAAPIYIGPSTTNTSNGFPLYPGEAACVVPGANTYMISQSGICTIAILPDANYLAK